jgi:regulator of protease activity HflC (stomatin/prohibitin superfamily)
VTKTAADRVKGARSVVRPFPRARLAQERQIMREANRWFAFEAARNIAQSRGKGAKAKAARDILKAQGPAAREAGRAMIQGRAQRAAAAAARGSKPAARALSIYDRQLAPVTPRGRGTGRNNLVPGPRNTKGPPPPKPKARKPRKPKR